MSQQAPGRSSFLQAVAQKGQCSNECRNARHRAVEEARLSWPGVRLSCEQFEQHLERLGCDEVCSAHISELYLCAGCSLGLHSAFRALEQRYFAALRGPIWRLVGDSDGVEDVIQVVRCRLLAGNSPKIATYRGSGSLSAWLRVVAVHAARDHRRARVAKRRQWLGLCRDLDCYVSRHTTPASPEDAAFERQCSRVCDEVLRTAIASLNHEERQLLQHYFIAGLNIDRIGQVYVINRATAARRINRSVARIRRKAHAELTAHFGRKTREELNAFVASLYEHLSLDAQDLARS